MKHRTARHGFTFVEAIIALSITSITAGALLLGVNSVLQTSYDSKETMIARGIAEQLVDEVLGKRYAASGVGPYQSPLGPNAWEAAGNARERFDDTDDYHGVLQQPAADAWGIELGQGDGAGGVRHPLLQLPSGYFDNWRQEIELYYVDETDPSVRLTGSQTSNLRAVEVKIIRVAQDGTENILAEVRRVFAYVPAPQ